MSNVEAVTIQNAQNLALFGTFHRPDQMTRNLPVVVLLSPGVKMRVGPGRLYVPLTRALNELRFPVLRFDFFGLGDSEGDLTDPMLADVYNHIEVGRYVDDTLSGLQWLTANYGYERFILGGLCGGAITALLAADKDHRVEALLSLGMTVTLASNAATPAKYLTQGQLTSLRRGYYQRLIKPESWVRLLTLKSDYGALWRSFWQLLPGGREQRFTHASQQTDSAEQQRGNANPLFPKAYLSFLERGGRSLMLFSGADRLRHEYEEKFIAPYSQRLQRFHSQIHTHVVADANHVLSFHEWQREMVSVATGWLNAIYGEPSYPGIGACAK